eukprot:472027-Rhodomonas_salina.1
MLRRSVQRTPLLIQRSGRYRSIEGARVGSGQVFKRIATTDLHVPAGWMVIRMLTSSSAPLRCVKTWSFLPCLFGGSAMVVRGVDSASWTEGGCGRQREMATTAAKRKTGTLGEEKGGYGKERKGELVAGVERKGRAEIAGGGVGGER